MNSRMTAKIQTILQGICINSEVSATVNQQYEILNQQNKSEKKKKKTLDLGTNLSPSTPSSHGLSHQLF